MGEVAKALGVGPEFEFEGATYQLAPLTFAMQAKFETWLEKRAWDAVRRARVHLPEEEYQAALSQVATDTASGVYSFQGKAARLAASTLAGVKRILLLSLQVKHREVDEDFVDRLTADEATVGEVVRLLGVANGAADPKAEATAVG